MGCKGDTQTLTNNGLSELLYDGNDGIYHTSTIGASLISMVGGNLVNKNATSVAEKESEKIAKKAAMQPADVVESGTDVIQSKFNKLLNSDYYKTDFGYDCSEVAQDFYDAAGQKGKIYRIEGKSGYINGYEYNNQVEYIYHEVYSDGIYIYDPRYTNVPVLKDDYFRALREINPDGFDVFEIMK